MDRAEEFKKALLSSRRDITDGQHKMLAAHYAASGHKLTATELAEAAEYPSYSAANLQYGLLGRTLGSWMSLKPEKRLDGSPVWTTILALGSPDSPDDGQFEWVMRPELARALEDLRWVKVR